MPDRQVKLIIQVDDKDVKQAEVSVKRLDDAVKNTSRVSAFGGKSAAEDEQQRQKLAAWMEREMPQAAKTAESAIGGVTNEAATMTTGIGQAAAATGTLGLGFGVLAAAGLGFVAVGVKVTETVYDTAKSFADYTNELDKTARENGITTQTTQALQLAGKEMGVEFSSIESIIESYRQTVGKAAGDNKEARDSLNKLGIDGKKAITDIDGTLQRALIQIDKMPDGLNKTVLGLRVFGDDWGKIQPLLKESHGNVGDLIKRFQELGVMVSDDDKRAAKEFQKDWTDVEEQLQSVKRTFGRDFLPVVRDGLHDFEGWLEKNKSTITGWADWVTKEFKRAASGITDFRNLAASEGAGFTASGWPAWLAGKIMGLPSKAPAGVGGFSPDEDAVAQRVQQNLANQTGTPDTDAVAAMLGVKQPKEKKQHVLSPQAKAIIDTATQLGISPLDLATLMLYETAGTLSTSIRGGKGNNYLGLIQFGPQEQKQFGAYSGQSFDSQMQSVAKYLTARGVTPGASLLQLYEAVNGGHVGVSDNLSDGNGTISQHVERMMRDRMPAAKKMFEGFSFDSQSVQDDVARMLSQQSDQLTKEQRDKSVQTIIMIWKAFGLIPDGSVLNEIQRVAADDAKKKGIAQPTAGDIRDIFVQNALAKQGVIAAIPTQPTQVIGQHLMLGEQYTANLKQSFGLTPQYDEKGQNTFQDRYSQLIIRQSQLEQEIGVRLKDQEQSRQEQTTELEVQLKLLQRGDLIADSELRATERHVYLQSEIRDLRIEILNLGKDDADQIEIARLEKIIELRNRDRDAVIAIQDAQLELNRAMDISNVQIRAGVYEHIAGARSMSQAYADGINQTYDALTKLVTGPLDKLEQKTKGLLSFIIEPAKAYSEHAIGNLFTGIVDKLFPGMGDTLKKAQDPVHYYGDKQVDLLTKIEANTRRSASGAAGAAGIFGGGGGSSLDDLLGGILHADDSGSGQSHGSPGSAAGGVFGDSGIGSATGSGTLWDNLKGLFSTNKGGIFAPQRNVLTGKDSKLGGILGGAGSLATLAGGLIGGNFGSVLSDVGMGLQIGAMFGPIGAIVGAGVGLIAGLFGISSKRKEEEKARTQAMLDAQDSLKQLDDIIASVRRGADPNAAIAQATSLGQQVKQQYLQTVSQLTDKKTRNIAIADASRIDAIVTQKINELRQVAEQAGAAADRDKRILPEFASGVYLSPDFQAFRRYNGLIPGTYDGADDINAKLTRGEMVLTPLQQNRTKRAAGFDVFAEAGIPNYPNSNPSPGLAAGGIAGAGTGLAGQIVVRPEFTLYMEGVIFTDQANAWIESDDGVRQLVKVVNKQKSDGAIR